MSSTLCCTVRKGPSLTRTRECPTDPCPTDPRAAENYVEDGDQMFRFDYSVAFLRWALQPPGTRTEWMVGVRVAQTHKLVAFISCTPAELSAHGIRLQPHHATASDDSAGGGEGAGGSGAGGSGAGGSGEAAAVDVTDEATATAAPAEAPAAAAPADAKVDAAADAMASVEVS